MNDLFEVKNGSSLYDKKCAPMFSMGNFSTQKYIEKACSISLILNSNFSKILETL